MIRNHGNVKNDQWLHCDFPTSVKACTTLIDKNKSNSEYDKKISAKKKEQLLNLIKTFLQKKEQDFHEKN